MRTGFWTASFGVAAIAIFLGASRLDAQAVKCKDGSAGKAGRGACSHHVGVATWL